MVGVHLNIFVETYAVGISPLPTFFFQFVLFQFFLDLILGLMSNQILRSDLLPIFSESLSFKKRTVSSLAADVIALQWWLK